MKNIIDLRDHQKIKAEAAEWLILLDRDDEPTADERRQLKIWLGRSPVHRRILKSSALLWGRLDDLADVAGEFGYTDPEPESERVTSGQKSIWREYSMAIAASVLIVMLFAGFYLDMSDISDSNGFYATAVGDQRTEILADGSTILLNTNSQIEVEFGEEYRDIYLLQGEVYFEVASNPDIPFRVFAGNGQVNAIGTAFAVYLRGSAVDVAVTEGRVSLAITEANLSSSLAGLQEISIRDRPSEELGILDAGQLTTIVLEAQSSSSKVGYLEEIQKVGATEMANRLSWQKGYVSFSGEPLEQVVEQISRYSTIQIELADASLRGMSVGGAFPVGEARLMLETLKSNFGLEVTWLDHNHVLVSLGES